jgi:hypothetical protein
VVTQLNFRGWRRPAVSALIVDVAGGRPRVRVPVQLRGTFAGEEHTRAEEVPLEVALAGPGDVVGLLPGTVTRRYPHPGVVDAETTKCPYVELADPDLPWRYTPQAGPGPRNRRLRPWLVLVVGEPDEVEVTGNSVTLAPTVLRDHPLADSHRWAHVQEAPGTPTLARVLSTRKLERLTGYVAALVPAYTVGRGQLADAWSAQADAPVTLPVFAHWRFRTGDGGDFRTLAASLEPGAASTSTGVAPMTYPRVPGAPLFGVRGALAPVRDGGPPPPPDDGEPPPDVDGPVPQAVAEDLRRLRSPATDSAGRPFIGLPRYGAEWTPDLDESGWYGDLNLDPRHRGVAGIGLRLGVELQEKLVADAVRQAGALDGAGRHVRDLDLGLAAGGSLWRRRLPADPGRRLWTFGPALRRVMTAAGPVDALATTDDRPLPVGWFSTATRRALRSGPPRTALAASGAADPVRLHRAANRPAPPVPFAETNLPAFAGLGAADFDEVRAQVVGEQRSLSDDLLDDILQRLPMDRFPENLRRGLEGVHDQLAGRPRGQRPWVRATQVLAALADGIDDPEFDPDAAGGPLADLADDFDGLLDDDATIRALLADLGDAEELPPPSRPVDVTGLAADLVAALDPTRAGAPVRRRVLDRITGLDPDEPLAPPEACIVLDLPVWRELARFAPDWLLPGVGQLDEDVVIAMETNPVFVDALMVGLNTRAVEELRWRNIRLAAGCTPLRTFWTRAAADGDGSRVGDIIGVRDWAATSPLGDPQHRPPGADGADLALVVRSRLFQRYPDTLFYLVSARHGGTVDFDQPPAPGAPRAFPAFQGRIGPDATFFGFPGLDGEDITEMWAVLEEPPSGFSFRNDGSAVRNARDGAQFADQAFDDPVRVLIKGDTLLPRGES